MGAQFGTRWRVDMLYVRVPVSEQLDSSRLKLDPAANFTQLELQNYYTSSIRQIVFARRRKCSNFKSRDTKDVQTNTKDK